MAAGRLYLERYTRLFTEGKLMPPITATTEVDRPAGEVFVYATDRPASLSGKKGVVEGHMEDHGTPGVGRGA